MAFSCFLFRLNLQKQILNNILLKKRIIFLSFILLIPYFIRFLSSSYLNFSLFLGFYGNPE